MSAGQGNTVVHPVRRHQRGSLFPRKKDGRIVLWIGKVRDPASLRTGHPRWIRVYNTDAQAAADELDDRIDELEAGLDPAGGYTVAGWLQMWVEEIHSPRVRPTTSSKTRSLIDNHITPAIGTLSLRRLKPQHLRRMIHAIPTSNTALACDIVMRRALADALMERVIDIDPSLSVDKPRHTAVRRPQLTAAQAQTFLEHARRHRDPFYARWAAAVMLGARCGELLGLQWDRVDLTDDNGTADLSWQLQSLPWHHGCTNTGHRTPTCGRRRPGSCPKRTPFTPRGFEHQPLHKNLALTRPKTKASIRLVPLPEPLRLLISEQGKNRATGPNPHNLLWHNPDGTPITHADDTRRFKALLAAAGLPDVTRHSMRATAATTLLDAGVDEATRMAILGHVTATEHRVYLDINASRIRTALANNNQLISGDRP